MFTTSKRAPSPSSGIATPEHSVSRTGSNHSSASQHQHTRPSSRQERERERDKNIAPFLPFYNEFTFLLEYQELQKNRPAGVYVLPSMETPQTWHGVIFVRDGPYAEGIFKFDLYIPNNFPSEECPTVQFTTPVFHPAVDPNTGLVELSLAFPVWHKKHHLWHIVGHVKSLFEPTNINTLAKFNPEAAFLFDTDRDAFLTKVAESVRESVDNVYETRAGKAGIQFEPWNQELYGPTLRALLNGSRPTYTSAANMAVMGGNGVDGTQRNKEETGGKQQAAVSIVSMSMRRDDKKGDVKTV